MTVSRLPLIVSLLLLVAAAPEAPPTPAASDAPPATAPNAPTAAAPNSPPAAAAPNTPPTATAPNVPPTPTVSNTPPATTVPNAPPATTAPEAPPVPTVPNTPPAATTPNAPSAATTPNAVPAPTVPKELPSATASKLPSSVVLQTFTPQEAMPVLGHSVVEPDGKTVARLIDVLVAPNGLPVAAVLDFGGFMGVGTRKIAVHWSTLRFESGKVEHRIILTLTPDEIKAAPEYKDPEKPAPVVVPVTPEHKSGPQ
jgi:hypothetical protein